MIKLIRVLLTVSFLLSTAHAEEVVLVPGTISGSVSINNVVVDQTYFGANDNSNRYSSSSNSTSSQYSLIVNVPDGGNRAYSVNATSYSDNFNDVINFKPVTVTAADGSPVALNYILQPCFINGKVTISGGTGGLYGYVAADLDSAGQYSNARTSFSSDGNFSFPVQANNNIRISADAFDSEGHDYEIVSTAVSCAAGESVTINLSGIAVDPPVINPSTIRGRVDLNNIAVIDQHSIVLSNANTVIYNGNGEYQLQVALGGQHALFATSQMNNGDDYLVHPDSSFVNGRNVDLPSNVVLTKNISNQAAFVNGTIKLNGSPQWQEISSASIGFIGTETTPTEGGLASDNINAGNGQFDLVLTQGSWGYERLNLQFNNSQFDQYLNSTLSIVDFVNNHPIILADKQTISNHDFIYGMGSAMINFSVKGGGAFTNASISANCVSTDQHGQTRYAASGNAYSKPGAPQSSAQVKFAGVAMPCSITATAIVGNSLVTFGHLDIIIPPGPEVIVDLTAPTLNVELPEPELYTVATAITVSGTASDDTGIKQITVNGIPVAFASTQNPLDPKEVEFATSVALANGANTITTIATDLANKTVSDTRIVYKDLGPPSLHWEPADGAMIANTSVLVTGTANDDNTIVSVTVNGMAVTFTSTGNGNEVAFSSPLSLIIGANQIFVTATDSAGLTNHQMHTVTRITNSAPIAHAGADQIIEATNSLTSVMLDGSLSRDPDGNALSYVWTGTFVVASGIKPIIKLGLGSHTIVLTVTDSQQNSSIDEVVITVRDTTAPILILPADLVLECKNSGGVLSSAPEIQAFIKYANAIDTVDPTPQISNNLPTICPPGTTKVVFTATDFSGNSSSAVANINVVDKTKPIVTAKLVAQKCSKSDDDDSKSRKQKDCKKPPQCEQDDDDRKCKDKKKCDKRDKRKQCERDGDDDSDDDDDDDGKRKGKGKYKVEFKCTDSCDSNAGKSATAKLNGVVVTNGQIVTLQRSKLQETKWLNGTLVLKAPEFKLIVICTDSSGNSSTAVAKVILPKGGDGDDDDDDDNEDDDKKNQKAKQFNKK